MITSKIAIEHIRTGDPMKFVRAIVLTTVALALGVPGVWAQGDGAKTGPNVSQRAAKTYRLTYTFTETDSGRRLGAQHFAMILVSGFKTVLKQGSKVPIATASNTGGPNTATQFTYLDVGINIEASLDELDEGVRLRTRIEQSSIAEEKSSVGTQDPVLRQTFLEGTSNLTQGKPLTLGSVDIPGTARHIDVEVVMEAITQ
jgi:hypothetical protein